MQQLTINLYRSSYLAACLGCIIFLYSALTFAGEMLKPKELVDRSDAVVMIKVDLKSGNIKVLEWLSLSDQLGDLAQHQHLFEASKSSLSARCVPRKRELSHWIKRFSKRKLAIKVWRSSLKLGQYESILHLRLSNKDKRIIAFCGVESLNATHWRGHPQFDKWLAEVKEGIHLKRASQNEEKPKER